MSYTGRPIARQPSSKQRGDQLPGIIHAENPIRTDDVCVGTVVVDHRREEAQDSGDAIPASRQAQSQMISSVSGKPTLNAPPIINANAESKFASLRIALPDIIAAP